MNKIPIVTYLLLVYIHFMTSKRNYKCVISLFHTDIFGCHKTNNISDCENMTYEAIETNFSKPNYLEETRYVLNYTLNINLKNSEKKWKTNNCIMYLIISIFSKFYQ